MRRQKQLRAFATTAVLTGVSAGCFGGSPVVDSRPSPPHRPGPAAEAAPAPVVFGPGVISTSDEEYRISFTPDGRTAYFSRSEEFFRRPRIYETRLVDGSWTQPQVASFSGEFSDIDPVVSPDGRRLYFSSNRPIGGRARSDTDVWVMEREGAGWGEPRNLGPEVNSDYNESDPAVDGAGNLFVGSNRPHTDGPERKYNIWYFEATADGFRPGVLLPREVNGDASVLTFNPAISVGGDLLLFTRLHVTDQESTGFGELYVSARIPGGWSPARNLGAPVNSPLDEFHGSFSPDGSALYFVRRDPNASDPDGDLYSYPIADLPEPLSPGNAAPLP